MINPIPFTSKKKRETVLNTATVNNQEIVFFFNYDNKLAIVTTEKKVFIVCRTNNSNTNFIFITPEVYLKNFCETTQTPKYNLRLVHELQAEQFNTKGQVYK